MRHRWVLKNTSAKEDAELGLEPLVPPLSVVVPKVEVMGERVDIMKVDEGSKAEPLAALMRE